MATIDRPAAAALLDVVRHIETVIREHSADAERERRLTSIVATRCANRLPARAPSAAA